MKQRILSIALALCMCLSVIPAAHAESGEVPTPNEVYDILISYRDKDGYTEGTTWTNSTHSYKLSVPIDGTYITGAGCAAFAFELSDAAFGTLPARMYSTGEFTFSDVKAGDILRLNNDAHTVIVLKVMDGAVEIAEGNYNSSVHWGRMLSEAEVTAASHYITRYPENYVAPDDPTANDVLGEGDIPESTLTWKLIKAGTLTISGSGEMPNFSAPSKTPWSGYMDQISTIKIEDGVTNVGSSAFYGSKAVSVTIPSSVTEIGGSAFRGSALVSVSIPGSVDTVGDSAFRECQNLSSVTIAEGVKKIDGNAFRSCTALTSITIPSSVTEAGAGAFFQCTELTNVAFKPGSATVTMDANLFSECQKLSTVILPQKIDCISEGMFQNCLMLTSVTIAEGAESIGGSAFASCGFLTQVWIPDSVTTIGTAAFSDCSNLKDIYYGGSESQWGSISKLGDTASALSSKTIHYNAEAPETPSIPDTSDPTNPSPNTPSTPGSSSSSSSSSTTTSTTTNPDGSTTTTKTDNRTGTVTETTKNPDGSQTVVETQKDGTVTTRETDQAGNKTETVANPDGSSTVTVEQKDGVSATVSTDAAGRVEAEVSLSASAVSAAQQSGGAVTLPIPEVQAARNTETAPAVTVNTGSTEPVKVEIPTVDPTPGTVAVIVHADGTEEVVKTSVPTADGVAVSLPDGATVKIVENSKDFADVSTQDWAADAIDFVSARELFAGTTETTFTPEAPMTRAMLMTVLARFDGADTTGGETWYDKSVEWAIANGISDGSSPDQSITREQMVTMFWRYAGSPSAAGALSGFADAGQINSYAQEAMCWAVENGIVSGGDGLLAPQGEATRAQVAQMLKNFLENY